MEDILYYNLQIGNASPETSGFTSPGAPLRVPASVNAKNTTPILQDPEEYYGSIIRFNLSGFNIPLIQFVIQTPVTDIDLSVYSFTLKRGAFTSGQTFVRFVPQVLLASGKVPVVGTATQDFKSTYYFLYDYVALINMLNTALSTANAALIAAGAPDERDPYFFYNASAQLITLYTPLANDEPGDAFEIYFNNQMGPFMTGFTQSEAAIDGVESVDGVDFRLTLAQPVGNSIVTFLSDAANTGWLATPQQFNGYGNWSFLKSLLIGTSMNVVSEVFAIDNPAATQNAAYINVLTDYMPDLGQLNAAGISAQTFVYNAPSLYRIFSFRQRNPLYQISINVQMIDTLGNVYPLQIDKGQQAAFKFMFIKKKVFQNSLAQTLAMRLGT